MGNEQGNAQGEGRSRAREDPGEIRTPMYSEYDRGRSRVNDIDQDVDMESRVGRNRVGSNRPPLDEKYSYNPSQESYHPEERRAQKNYKRKMMDLGPEAIMELRDMENVINELELDNDRLKKEEIEMTRMRAQLMTLKRDVEEVEQIKATMDGDFRNEENFQDEVLESLKKRYAQLVVYNKEISRSLMTDKSELKVLQAEYQKNHYGKDAETLNVENRNIKNELKEINQEFSVLVDELENVNKNIDVINKQLDYTRTEIAKLKANNETMDRHLRQEVNMRKSQVDGKSNELAYTLSEKQTQLTFYQKENDKLRTRLNELIYYQSQKKLYETDKNLNDRGKKYYDPEQYSSRGGRR